MSERSLLDSICAANAALRGFGELVAVPPGDDMAALRLRRRELLVAVDQVIEGRHFLPGTAPALIARKALCRNLSDVAAMAASPLACVAAATLPRSMSLAEAAALFESLRSVAASRRCPLVGGDTGTLGAVEGPLVLSVTVLAELPEGIARPVLRRGARAGDGLFVTGALGGSFGRDGMGRHLTFEPRVAEAIELRRALGGRLHAMIDLSDGLGSDAGHLAEAAGLVARIDARALPCAPGCDWRSAYGDGEDYELCFAAEEPVPRTLLGLAVTRIGEMTPRASPDAPPIELLLDGAPVDPVACGVGAGWEHRLGAP
ncbi:MAG TPA: thiamine-phosphate kinase [Phycisphaerales bacterium]|nr:thiamine-phosphate kinase [Phycisphaerales bacterium]HMP36500.1 thiamine-phosphate kinase [Phycisphaerales bacterium]